jgi:hypothetical protein
MALAPPVTSAPLSVFYGSAEKGLKNNFSEPTLIGVPRCSILSDSCSSREMLSGLITDLQDLIFADSSCFIVTHDL